eukprot:NODE_147_length_15617_cov_0.576750.p6 type:complete len:284 gc:universal NODE_147_length_15617_cov_0.576750:909-1760(+)
MIHIISSLQMIFTLLIQIASISLSKRYFEETETEIVKYVMLTEKSDSIQIDDYISLKNEISILSKLDHPNIIKIFKYDDNEEVKLVSYEMHKYKYDLFNLYDTEFRRNAYDHIDEIFKIIYQILNAMNYMKSKNVAHRDIKPENIMIDDENNAILADFGWATANSNVKSTTHSGTKIYAAPEVLMCLDKNKRCSYDPNQSDLFSLGIMIWRMFHYKFPFFPKQRQNCSELNQIFTDQMFTKLKNEDKLGAILAVSKLLMQCTPSKRPTAAKLLEMDIFKSKSN